MKKSMGITRNYMLPCFVGMVYMFMYAPIIVLIVFSFNVNPFSYSWYGFTTEWYYDLFCTYEVWHALKNSLIVATSSVCITLLLALFFVCFVSSFYMHRLITSFYAILAVPEVIIAVGMLLLFSVFSIYLSFFTLIVGHTLLGLGYAVPVIHSRFMMIDDRLMHVSRDLGATHMQTFARITLPLLLPSLVSSALLVFIISFDDFVFSFFCAGSSVQTLPLYIFSLIRSGSTPMVNALSTLLLLVSNLLVLLFSRLAIRKTGKI